MRTITRKELMSLLGVSKLTILHYESKRLLKRIEYKPAKYVWDEETKKNLREHFRKYKMELPQVLRGEGEK